MSHEATEFVWKLSPYKGTSLLIHLAIAEVVNELHQWRYWGGDAAIAERARCERTTVHRWKRTAMADGYLVEHGIDPETRHKQYLFLMPGGMLQDATSDPDGMLQNATSDVAKTAPDVATASGTPITNRRTEENVSARAARAEDPMVGFDDFWKMYPERNGRQLGRGKAEAIWKKLSIEDKRAAWRAAVNYRTDCDSGLQTAQDPFRWLRDREWTAFDGPAKITQMDSRRPMTPRQRGQSLLLRQIEADHAGQ